MSYADFGRCEYSLTAVIEMMYIISQRIEGMRYSAEHKHQMRERIVRAAARRFRARGSEGAAVADLMRDLRLTHGGFYRHFASKEQLFALAFEQSLKEVGTRVTKAIEQAPPGRELKTLIDTYLDPDHCSDVSGGCPVAALASEVARRPSASRGPFLQALRSHIRRMSKYLPAATDEERCQKAIALFSGMAGTLTIARAFTDERDRRAILEGARTFFLAAAER
jgi:TetR/AcrR family transcriptional regulator, transcriptional repressor for nem operon